MAFTNKSMPKGMITLETIDQLTVGTRVYKVYPPSNGNSIATGIIRRAPYCLPATGVTVSDSLWIDLEGGSSFLMGQSSLSDSGVARTPYNTNRMFLNEDDAKAYLNHMKFKTVTDDHGRSINISVDSYNALFGGQ